MTKEYLQPIKDGRKSFYKKAHIERHLNEQNIEVISLYSYNTLVCYIIQDIDKPIYKIIGLYSQTTTRHIKEFLYQNGFGILSTKELEVEGK